MTAHAILAERVHELESSPAKRILVQLIHWARIHDKAPQRQPYGTALMEAGGIVAAIVPIFMQIACGHSAEALLKLLRIPDDDWDILVFCIGLAVARSTDLMIGASKFKGNRLAVSVARLLDRNLLAMVQKECPDWLEKIKDEPLSVS